MRQIWPYTALFFVKESTIRLKRPRNRSQTEKFSLWFPKSGSLLYILFLSNPKMMIGIIQPI